MFVDDDLEDDEPQDERGELIDGVWVKGLPPLGPGGFDLPGPGRPDASSIDRSDTDSRSAPPERELQ